MRVCFYIFLGLITLGGCVSRKIYSEDLELQNAKVRDANLIHSSIMNEVVLSNKSISEVENKSQLRYDNIVLRLKAIEDWILKQKDLPAFR